MRKKEGTGSRKGGGGRIKKEKGMRVEGI